MKKFFFFLSIFIFFTFFFSSAALATTIFSPLLELEVEPGQTQGGIVKVYNETSDILYLTSSVEPFTAGDETGQPVYLPPEEKYNFLKWFKVAEDSLILKPKQVAIIPFTVTVPNQAIAGGYYATIFWGIAAGEAKEGPAVGISSKVGTLIFLKVKGEVVEKGELLEFKAKPPKNYFFRLPINFIVRLKNSGNVHIKPKGFIELKNQFGQVEILEVNKEKRNIIPDSIRKFEILWGETDVASNFWQNFWSELKAELNHFTLGKYTATLDLNYGSDNPQTIKEEIIFWFIPLPLIITLLFIVIILLVLAKINSRVKKLKRSVKT